MLPYQRDGTANANPTKGKPPSHEWIDGRRPASFVPENRHHRRPTKEKLMRLSTRNQFPGTVVAITIGEAMSTVKIAVDGTDIVVTAAVTKDAVEDLGLTVGAKAYALVKATEVQLAID
jgi:molybdopterin-binding protein